MNQIMIHNWNAVVSPTDTVIHVGDFGMGLREKHIDIFNQLNGEKHLIVGNHDIKETLKMPWASINKNIIITTPVGDIYFSHHPIGNLDIRKKHETEDGIVMWIHGHNHRKADNAIRNNVVDVGVDAWGFHPVRLKTLINKVLVTNREMK